MTRERALVLRRLLLRQKLKLDLIRNSDIILSILLFGGMVVLAVVGVGPWWITPFVPVVFLYMVLGRDKLLKYQSQKVKNMTEKINQELDTDTDEVSGIRVRVKSEGPARPISKNRC